MLAGFGTKPPMGAPVTIRIASLTPLMVIEWIKEVAVPGGTVAGASAGSGTVAVVSAGSELVIGGEGGKLANAGVGGEGPNSWEGETFPETHARPGAEARRPGAAEERQALEQARADARRPRATEVQRAWATWQVPRARGTLQGRTTDGHQPSCCCCSRTRTMRETTDWGRSQRRETEEGGVR